MGSRRMCLPLRTSEENACTIFHPKMEIFLRSKYKTPQCHIPHDSDIFNAACCRTMLVNVYKTQWHYILQYGDHQDMYWIIGRKYSCGVLVTISVAETTFCT
jgi:hypothetical protein